ncbi:MAG UNVERIFIED_CONTAM: hypothetical protein LVR18_01115 [Planctomycetaceae bacterium]|jgi:hypothetical protein
MDWEHVREGIDTAVLPQNLNMGGGNDFLTIPGNLTRTMSIFSFRWV